MEKVIEFNTSLSYILERKKIKNLYIRIKEGQLFVSAPYLVSLKSINDFIDSKKSLIIGRINEQRNEKTDDITLFGKKTTKEKLDEYVVNSGMLYLKEQVFYYYKMMKLGNKLPGVKIKQMKTAYAIYHKNTHSITFNTILFKYDKEIIDYVVVHELSHIKHMDHSANFWRLVGVYCPNYKELRTLLKKGN